jgi:hypothetical protein
VDDAVQASTLPVVAEVGDYLPHEPLLLLFLETSIQQTRAISVGKFGDSTNHWHQLGLKVTECLSKVCLFRSWFVEVEQRIVGVVLVAQTLCALPLKPHYPF